MRQPTIATLPAIPRLAVAHARAVLRRGHPARRLFLPSYAVLRAVILLDSVPRGEVLTEGRGTSVTLTRTPRDRPNRQGRVVATLTGVGLTAVTAATTAAAMTAPSQFAWIAAILLAALLSVPLSGLVVERSRPVGGQVVVERPMPDGDRVWLHDLVRHPVDPAGAAVALLAAALAHERWRTASITAVAATAQLADRYQAAGMARHHHTAPTPTPALGPVLVLEGDGGWPLTHR